MKKLSLLCAYLSFCVNTIAQPSFSWANSVGSTLTDEAFSVTVDASGNVYSMGNFTNTVDFDPGPGTYNLTATVGGVDIFITKSDASGNLLWAARLGGTGNQYASSITTDATGNVYSTGLFEGTVDFDPGIATVNLTSAGQGDIFISKLDASGNYVWARRMGGTSSDAGLAIKVGNTGEVYSTGSFAGTVDFDPTGGVFNLTASNYDVYVSKLDASGNFVWAVKMGGANSDNAYGLALDASNNVYTVGSFNSTADFDPGAGVFNLVSAGGYDIYVSKLDVSGNFVWAAKMGSTSSDQAEDIALDASGNVYTTGFFNTGTNDFDPGAGVFSLTNAGSDDIFVSKLDASGNFVWAKSMGSNGADYGYAIATDNAGNAYVTGGFMNTCDFDPGVSIFNLSSAGIHDIFITKLDASGNFSWAQRMGSTDIDNGMSVHADGFGNIYTVGYFKLTVDLDGSAGVYNAISSGDSDAFLHKLSDCTAPTTPAGISGNTAVCAGTSNSYSVSSVAGATSYTWTLPGGWSGTSTTNSISATAGSTTGTISVTANNACGSSTAQTLNVTVNNVPAMPATIMGPITLCAGDFNAYNVNPVSGATSYTWIIPGDWTGTSTTDILTVTAGSSSGFVYVTADNACGSSPTQQLQVTVNTPPATPGSISGNTTICAGTSQTYSIASVAGATSYTWSLPSGWTGTSTSSSINVTTGSVGGNITVTADNSCGNSSAQSLTVTVNTVPSQPSSITGNNSVCENSSQNYSVTNDVTATSYTWSLPATWSGSSTTNSITSTAGSGSGQISVTANNSCGSSTAQTLSVTVNPLPTVTLVLSANSVCVDNAVFVLTVASPSGGTFAGTGVNSGSFNAATAGIGIHNITYSFTDGNGCSNTDTDQMTVNNCTGVSDNEILNIEIYPNPFTNEINVNGDFNGETHVELINVVGELILNTQITSNAKLQTSNLPSGIYFLNIITSAGLISKKIIKN